MRLLELLRGLLLSALGDGRPLPQLSYAEVSAAYAIVLGRAPENSGVALAASQGRLLDLIVALVTSDEFRTSVANPILSGNLVEGDRFRTRLLGNELADALAMVQRIAGPIQDDWVPVERTYRALLNRIISTPKIADAVRRLGAWSSVELSGRLFGGGEVFTALRDRGKTYDTVEDYLRGKIHGANLEAWSGLSLSADARSINLDDEDPWIQIQVQTDPHAKFLSIKIDALARDMAPDHSVLYLDYGHGYSEARSLIDYNTRNAFLIGNPSLVRRVRWDPDIAPGPFTLHAITVRTCDAAQVAVEAGAKTLKEASYSQQLQAGLEQIVSASWQAPADKEGAAFDWTRTFRKVNALHDDKWEAYHRWIARNERPLKLEKPVESAAEELSLQVSIVMFTQDPPLALLEASIDSVLDQDTPDWELCIIDAGSVDRKVKNQLNALARADPRIKVTFVGKGGGAALWGAALGSVSAPWLLRLGPQDVLAKDAVRWVAHAASANPSIKIIYSDEDRISEADFRYDPFFKPEMSVLSLRSYNFLRHASAFSVEMIGVAGGMREGFDDAEEYDLALRIIEGEGETAVLHIPRVLYHRRATASSAAAELQPHRFSSERYAIVEHLDRTGFDAVVEAVGSTPYHRVRPKMLGREPRVSLIIPTRDRAKLLYTCVRSILERTDYYNYEIIIADNGSSEPATFEVFDELCRESHISVMEAPGEFNYSAINNAAARISTGEVIGLINNDIEVIAGGWLREMLSWAVLPSVGCVGAKLYYPDDTVQHAGVIIGLGRVAGHSHKLYPRNDPGYFGRLSTVHEVSAVTAACLLVRKAVFWEAGGLDEENLKIAYNDVDLCLKVRERGYKNVFTPYAELYHHESVSRGIDDVPVKKARLDREIAYMQRRWGTDGYRDPFYSPNLTVEREDFGFH